MTILRYLLLNKSFNNYTLITLDYLTWTTTHPSYLYITLKDYHTSIRTDQLKITYLFNYFMCIYIDI